MSDTPFAVSVRTLCAFGARRGDLDTRFTPAPSAQQGMDGHRAVTARRPAHYRTEVPLSGCHGLLRVRGRADGYDPEAGRLEEIKTHRGDADRVPAHHRALHRAQACTYAWLLCAQESLPGLEVALVYYDIERQRETVSSEWLDAGTLRRMFEALCEPFLAWATQERAHREARDGALRALAFPFGGFRSGQRGLAEAVYRVHAAGRCLLAQAPTGIGKTVGTLYPALKALAHRGQDQLYVLSAKTTGRQLAMDGLSRLATGRLRVLELVARDKACEHPDKACHGESCPLARGFYDRLNPALGDAVGHAFLDRERLRATALAHAICPYYLGQALARWADVVVGDYNHYLDLNALLPALAESEGLSAAVLVDEAHNLVERARAMYSATLALSDAQALRASAPVPLRRGLSALLRCWKALAADAPASGEGVIGDQLPDAWLAALQRHVAALTAHQADHPLELDGAWLAWYFDALNFLKLAERFGPHSLVETSAAGRDCRVALRNVVPAPHLRPRWNAAHGATLFSATLAPAPFQRDLLGLPDNTAWLDVASPFQARQLQVVVARELSTRWRDRARSLTPLVERMAAQYHARPGNYLAFFSSHDYLQQAAARLAERHPDLPQWQQTRAMGEAERLDFIARFTPEGRGIGFAVLGGAFGEGIDLPGRRLIGAFIATLGLPQVNPLNEEMKRRIEAQLGHGHDYTYLFPGLQRVVQAAGRVIRTPEDEGVVLLLDDRFARPEVRALLPAWWAVSWSTPIPRNGHGQR